MEAKIIITKKTGKHQPLIQKFLYFYKFPLRGLS
nr:MAG TPA: hypothetical protein [Caudoviricetes sp.]